MPSTVILCEGPVYPTAIRCAMVPLWAPNSLHSQTCKTLNRKKTRNRPQRPPFYYSTFPIFICSPKVVCKSPTRLPPLVRRYKKQGWKYCFPPTDLLWVQITQSYSTRLRFWSLPCPESPCHTVIQIDPVFKEGSVKKKFLPQKKKTSLKTGSI